MKQSGETYIRPKEGAKKLKIARKLMNGVYLYGVTGVGKTTLVRDILSRRRYEYYSAREIGAGQIAVKNDRQERIVVIDI